MANEKIEWEPHRCPRRGESLLLGRCSCGSGPAGGHARTCPLFDESKPDGYNQRGSHMHCSYCGSLHEADFWQCVDAGEELGPTDKSYKVYVGHTKKFYFQHLSQIGRMQFVDYWNEQKMKIGFPGHFYTPPFFVVLTGSVPLQD